MLSATSPSAHICIHIIFELIHKIRHFYNFALSIHFQVLIKVNYVNDRIIYRYNPNNFPVTISHPITAKQTIGPQIRCISQVAASITLNDYSPRALKLFLCCYRPQLIVVSDALDSQRKLI